MSDNVNHPSHYETGKFECIDVMVETQGIQATKDPRHIRHKEESIQVQKVWFENVSKYAEGSQAV